MSINTVHTMVPPTVHTMVPPHVHRQGLLEPPKPKVKIANLYRVLGEQAVADPTAMEREARKQMAERQVGAESALCRVHDWMRVLLGAVCGCTRH